MSPLAWGRGLKLSITTVFMLSIVVAPRVGAWIETMSSESLDSHFDGRPSRGGVD